jgi:hypothetical protein
MQRTVALPYQAEPCIEPVSFIQLHGGGVVAISGQLRCMVNDGEKANSIL